MDLKFQALIGTLMPKHSPSVTRDLTKNLPSVIRDLTKSCDILRKKRKKIVKTQLWENDIDN